MCIFRYTPRPVAGFNHTGCDKGLAPPSKIGAMIVTSCRQQLASAATDVPLIVSARSKDRRPLSGRNTVRETLRNRRSCTLSALPCDSTAFFRFARVGAQRHFNPHPCIYLSTWHRVHRRRTCRESADRVLLSTRTSIASVCVSLTNMKYCPTCETVAENSRFV